MIRQAWNSLLLLRNIWTQLQFRSGLAFNLFLIRNHCFLSMWWYKIVNEPLQCFRWRVQNSFQDSEHDIGQEIQNYMCCMSNILIFPWSRAIFQTLIRRVILTRAEPSVAFRHFSYLYNFLRNICLHRRDITVVVEVARKPWFQLNFK